MSNDSDEIPAVRVAAIEDFSDLDDEKQAAQELANDLGEIGSDTVGPFAMNDRENDDSAREDEEQDAQEKHVSYEDIDDDWLFEMDADDDEISRNGEEKVAEESSNRRENGTEGDFLMSDVASSSMDQLGERQSSKPKAPQRPVSAYYLFLIDEFGEDYLKYVHLAKDASAEEADEERRRWIALGDAGQAKYNEASERDWEAYVESCSTLKVKQYKRATRTLERKLKPYKEKFRPQNILTGKDLYLNQREMELKGTDASLDVEKETKRWIFMKAEDKKSYNDRASLGTAEYQQNLRQFEELCKLVPPPFPMNPFNVFRRLEEHTLLTEWRASNEENLSVDAFYSAKWRQLSEDKKRKYEDISKEEKIVYAERLKEFQRVPWVSNYIMDEAYRKRRLQHVKRKRRKKVEREEQRDNYRISEEKRRRREEISAAAIRVEKGLAVRLAEPEDRAKMTRERCLVVDWKALGDSEYGEVPLQRTDDLESMVGWATHITGTTKPEYHNPLLGLANIPPRTAELQDSVLARANNLASVMAHDESLRNLQFRFDQSALVALGMLLEDSMVALLLPFANEHVKKCRDYELHHDGHSPRWLDPPEKAIAELGSELPLITNKAPCRVSRESKEDSKSTWETWCEARDIDASRRSNKSIFFFSNPQQSRNEEEEKEDDDAAEDENGSVDDTSSEDEHANDNKLRQELDILFNSASDAKLTIKDMWRAIHRKLDGKCMSYYTWRTFWTESRRTPLLKEQSEQLEKFLSLSTFPAESV